MSSTNVPMYVHETPLRLSLTLTDDNLRDIFKYISYILYHKTAFKL